MEELSEEREEAPVETPGEAASARWLSPVRLRTPERRQLEWVPRCLDDLVSPQHPVRLIAAVPGERGLLVVVGRRDGEPSAVVGFPHRLRVRFGPTFHASGGLVGGAGGGEGEPHQPGRGAGASGGGSQQLSAGREIGEVAGGSAAAREGVAGGVGLAGGAGEVDGARAGGAPAGSAREAGAGGARHRAVAGTEAAAGGCSATCGSGAGGRFGRSSRA